MKLVWVVMVSLIMLEFFTSCSKQEGADFRSPGETKKDKIENATSDWTANRAVALFPDTMKPANGAEPVMPTAKIAEIAAALLQPGALEPNSEMGRLAHSAPIPPAAIRAQIVAATENVKTASKQMTEQYGLATTNPDGTKNSSTSAETSRDILRSGVSRNASTASPAVCPTVCAWAAAWASVSVCAWASAWATATCSDGSIVTAWATGSSCAWATAWGFATACAGGP